MSRSRTEYMLLVLLGILALGRNAPAQDRTADWLEANNLDAMLVLHLERERAGSVGNAERRERIASRLAEVYARRLETETSGDEREELIRSAERLLESGDADRADALRLALLRARYLLVSGLLEDDRAALAEPDVVQGARSEVTELAERFRILRRSIDEKQLKTNRLLGRASGLRARSLQMQLEQYQDLAMSAALLHGWTLYYLGRIDGDRDALRSAEEAFGLVLQGEQTIPEVEDVSEDLQEYEFYASGVLGMALTIAAVDGYRSSLPWFERLERPVTHPAIREGVDGWRLAGALDAGAFDDAVIILEGFGDRPEVPAAWLRIAAVGGLERTDGPGSASRRLAARALALLAGNGELAQVVDLAERYGLEAIGNEGFAFRYVRGVQHYREAVKARDELRAADARAAFERAAAELTAAVSEPDAQQFRSALGGSLALAGWSLIELEFFEEAAGVFIQAAERSQGSRRADAEWGAIVALDRLIATGGDATEDARLVRDQRIAEFLDRFPADDRAPTLVVRRIADRVNPTADDVQTLLNVPPDHPSWEMARRRAAQTLYARFRNADPDARAEPGNSFLEVAEDILERDRSSDPMFSDLSSLDGVLLRQVVEVATHAAIADVDRAGRWLAVLEQAVQHGAFDDQPDLPNELAYRRLALDLVRGDLVAAVVRLEQLPVDPSTEDAGQWTAIAARRLHLAGTRRIEAGEPITQDVVQAVVAGGERLLESDERTLAEVLENPRMLPVAVQVANGRAALYRSAGNPDEGLAALAIYQELLAVRPRDGSILEAAAELSRELGEYEVSLELWRRIASGAPQGSQRWWKARTNLVELLAETDPAQARRVLDQHRQLHPDFGQPPWGDRLRTLQDRLDVEQAGSVESEDTSSGEDQP